MKQTPTAFLDRISSELDAIDAQARVLLDRLDTATFNRQPTPGRWSAGQCFDHLVQINIIYIQPIDRSMRRAREQKLMSDQPFGHSFIERYFIWMLEPPARIRLPAPPRVQAHPTPLELATVRSAYFQGHEAIRDFLKEARGVDIKRSHVQSPFASQLKFSLAAALDIMMAHERRHLLQAERAANSQ